MSTIGFSVAAAPTTSSSRLRVRHDLCLPVIGRLG